MEEDGGEEIPTCAWRLGVDRDGERILKIFCYFLKIYSEQPENDFHFHTVENICLYISGN